LAELEDYRMQRFAPTLSPVEAFLSVMLDAVNLGPRPGAGSLGGWLATLFRGAEAVLNLDYRNAGVLVWCPRCDLLTP
jgi:hypothetical protein